MSLMDMWGKVEDVKPSIMDVSDDDFSDVRLEEVLGELKEMSGDSEPVKKEKVHREVDIHELPFLMEKADPKVLAKVIDMVSKHASVTTQVDSFDAAVMALDQLPKPDKKRLYKLLTNHKLDRL
ncbi:hypothetical protein [Vibrio crassostreae]|uniref:hypothetical protein n=1 Tax=Vibrio crassostreae TaxID=246167 RepID=UPI001B31405E|nr:hypothetical protein [Vibrio crassostreae]